MAIFERVALSREVSEGPDDDDHRHPAVTRLSHPCHTPSEPRWGLRGDGGEVRKSSFLKLHCSFEGMGTSFASVSRQAPG